MTERKGLLARAAQRIRKAGKPEPNVPAVVERGPAQHGDDDRMHISGDVEGTRRDDGSTGRDCGATSVEGQHSEAGATSEELDRGSQRRRRDDV